MPKGYSRDEKKRIYINKDGYLIGEAFELLLKGYTITEVQKEIALKGFNITTKRWYDVFNNPFYCGMMLSRSNNYKPLEGTHPKIISVVKFKRINGSNFTVPTLRTNDQSINSQLPLKGYLKCECGFNFTGYINKKKKRAYYICNNFDCRKSVSALLINSTFLEHLKNQLPIELSNQLLTSKLTSFLIELETINEQLIIEQREELKKSKGRLYKLADALMDGELDKKLFKERYGELELQVSQEEQKLFDLDIPYLTSKIPLKH